MIVGRDCQMREQALYVVGEIRKVSMIIGCDCDVEKEEK